MTTRTLPYQIDPATLPALVRDTGALFIDFRKAVAPGALLEEGEFRDRDKDGVPDRVAGRTLACMHVWLNRGDVGIGSKRVRQRRWSRFVQALSGKPFVPRVGAQAAFDEAVRYLGAPYHVSAGVADVDGKPTPLVVLAHPADAYTHHAGALNRHSVGLGFAWGRGESCDPVHIRGHLPASEYAKGDFAKLLAREANARARRDAVLAGIWACAHFYSARTLVTHAQSSAMKSPRDDGRGGDPGMNVLWAAGHALERLHQNGGQVFVEPVRTWGSGCAWPDAWRKACGEGEKSAGAALILLSEREVAEELTRLKERACFTAANVLGPIADLLKGAVRTS